MIRFQLPTDEIEYLQLAFPAGDTGLVVKWGTQFTPFTVGTWDGAGRPLGWQLADVSDRPKGLCLSPDGEWVSIYDRSAGEVRVTRVGADRPTAVVPRAKDAPLWTAIAPGGVYLAWKEDQYLAVRALPDGEPIARVKSGSAYEIQFSPGGRWLTEEGDRVFRVFDRANKYRVFARVPKSSYVIADVADGPTAVLTAPDRASAVVWDLSGPSATATLPVGAWTTSVAISADGRRVLTGEKDREVVLWDAVSGARLHAYDWKVATPIAAAFSRDGMRAAVGGTAGQVVVWDLDD